jgi:NADH-quinone oxidoreductase subunit A
MIFIPFDIEVALLVPLAVRFNVEPQFLFWQALIFIAILGVGYVYILKRGVLNWK